jgi:hypothetical protein
MHAVAEAREVAMYSTTRSTEAVYDIREARNAVKESTLPKRTKKVAYTCIHIGPQSE